MAAFSLDKLLEGVKQNRERGVIIVLLVILLAISWNIYSTLQRQRAEPDRILEEILIEHGYPDSVARAEVKDQLDPLSVAEGLLNVPSPDDVVRPLIEVDPLRPREDIHQIRKRIGMLMEEGRLLREQGKWADAIVTYDAVLELDPSGVKYDYRGGTPGELKAVCLREQTRERMAQAKSEADENYQRGMEHLNAGDDLKARDVLLQARREYARILDLDPERTILDEAFYAAIDSRIEELAGVTTELVRKTLSQDIASKREQAENELAAYEADPSEPSRLAAAREALVESLSVVDLVDPQRSIVGAAEVAEIEALLNEVREMISKVLPDLVARTQEQLVALKSAQNAEEGILKGEAALASIDLLRRLRPEEPTFQERYAQVQTVIQELRRRVDLQRAQSIYAEAESHYRRGLEAVQRNDPVTSANERETALAVLGRLRALPQENIGPWLAKAQELEADIVARLRALPRVRGVQLTEVDPQGRWVRLRSDTGDWQDTRHDLGTRNPKTQIQVEEIHPNPGGEPPYAVISRPLHMKTKVSLGTG